MRDIICLEQDPIALFINTQFPDLKKASSHGYTTFKNINLKFKIFLDIIECAMSTSRPVILSNGNIFKDARKIIYQLSRKNNYKLVGIYLNLPDALILERIKKDKKNKDILNTSKNFQEVFTKQSLAFVAPQKKDFYKLFEIKSIPELENLEKKLVTLFE